MSPCYYSKNFDVEFGILNSKCTNYFLKAINPTVTSPVGDVAKLPLPDINQINILGMKKREGMINKNRITEQILKTKKLKFTF